VQVDYTLPERFDLEYIGPDGQPHRPVMIHRAPFGSLERLIGILIEHYAGAFPLWLAPVQVIVLPIADRHVPYAQQIRQRLEEEGYRARIRNHGHSCFLCEIVIRSQFHTTYEPEA
jgi:threonyl-tRNA synthetase (EC 6.1.1.3)/Ser-tRNA(Thr) hydrolase (EC 3.1.1.-)